MKPFSAPKKISHAKARNAALLNLLATPGLGSLIAGRWVAGAGQLALAVAGFALILIWFVKIIVPYYGLMFGDVTPPPVNGRIGILGGGVFMLSWAWSLVTSISLMREAGQMDVDSMKSFSAGLVKVDEAGIVRALTTLPKWQRAGEMISRTFEFKDFPAAMNFVNAVAALAERVQHHPDIDVRWNKVTLALTTHDVGGLTERDFAFARQCDAFSGN